MYKCDYKVRYHVDKECSLELDPHDFIKCDTKRELKREVESKLRDSLGVDYFSIVDSKVKIPEEFIKEWERLVDFIPNNVMTPRMRNIMMERSSRTNVFSGGFLNSRRNKVCSNGELSLNVYDDFYFDPKKNYKCWIVDVDHWEWSDEYVAYCEETNQRAFI